MTQFMENKQPRKLLGVKTQRVGSVVIRHLESTGRGAQTGLNPVDCHKAVGFDYSTLLHASEANTVGRSRL